VDRAVGPADAALTEALLRRRRELRPLKEFEGDVAYRLVAANLPHLVSVGTSPNPRRRRLEFQSPGRSMPLSRSQM
jgi:hypothetical protein